jgi:hypothetical protein
MRAMSRSARASRASFRRPVVVLTCAVAVPWLALAPAAMGGTATASLPIASATLQQCATATIPQTERAATFAGEMTSISGTARMEIRIDLQERAPGEPQYHIVSAPGLGVWHSSAAGVKIFTHIQQVTNLSAPAFYRGLAHFRWLSTKGHLLKSEELRTARCEQPAPPPSSTGTSVPSPIVSSSTTTSSSEDAVSPAST